MGWLSEGTSEYVVLQSEAYPISVELMKAPGFAGSEVIVEEITGSGTGATYRMLVGDKITVSSGNVSALKISSAVNDEAILPSEFALKGNYPNPFNPTTQLVFDLPEAAVVQVDVFDMLGRKVLSVPAQELGAGAQHKVQLDASELASGIYLYTIQANMASKTVHSSGRMTLLK